MTDVVFSIKTPEIQAEIDELQGAMWDLESGGHHDGIKREIPYIQLRAEHISPRLPNTSAS
jgi:hypothetical protein|tara:strand:+ start:52 stop:234 length:183 start_codon:yes stop_codon:yes gene_type:complete